ncbi:hypothetical protein EVAR_102543_1 [Eumeta japonica]|uniref:Uncharacterized protein n=1 Tax=Eumeta variegata TaxID=151549 RepID=A0A4C1S8D3_EUMVA|nr:hypothetical protein EVAR_102543_1 [Eumeta japonica]
MAKRGKLVLLVKTGANSSIVKEEAMNVFPGESIPESKKLKGVSTTLGVVKIDVGIGYTISILGELETEFRIKGNKA